MRLWDAKAIDVEIYSGGYWDSLVCIKKKTSDILTTYLLMRYTHSFEAAYFSDIFTAYLQLLCETAYAYKDKR